MLQAFKSCSQFCIFRGTLRDVEGDNTTIVIFIVLLLLLELNPLVSLFTSSEIASKLLEHRIIIWLLALVWHAGVIVLIFLSLKLRHLVNRLRSLLVSYFGVFVLFQLMGLLLQLLDRALIPTVMQTVLSFVWLTWGCGVFGYVFGSALDIKLYQGVIVALAVNVLSYFAAFVLIALVFSDQLMKIFQQ